MSGGISWPYKVTFHEDGGVGAKFVGKAQKCRGSESLDPRCHRWLESKR